MKQQSAVVETSAAFSRLLPILRDQRASWKHTLFLPKLFPGQRATSECWVYRWALLCQAEILGFISYAHNTGRLCHMKEYI